MCSLSLWGLKKKRNGSSSCFPKAWFYKCPEMQCVGECPKSSNSFLFFYLFPEGPDGILSVFCKLNLLVGTFSADWDKLMLRFLKNSNPPLELGSYDDTQRAVS